jgi:hypothetical protein
MNKLTHLKRFNESEENLNISDVRSSKKFKVIIWVNTRKYGFAGKDLNNEVIFSDIIESDNLINATDTAFGIVGIEKITSYDEVDVSVAEIK